MMWEILPRQLSEEIYYSLKSEGLLLVGQKEYYKETKGTSDLLFWKTQKQEWRTEGGGNNLL